MDLTCCTILARRCLLERWLTVVGASRRIVQRLAQAILSIAVLFGPAPALAAIAVTVLQPVQNQVVGGTLYVAATVSSPASLQTVHAQVASLGNDLAYTATGWTGTVDLSALTRGAQNLTVTATDVNGVVGTAQVSFFFDLPPVLTVAAPARWSVARPQLPIAATCTDDDPAGCSSLSVSYSGPFMGSVVVATGTSSINQMLDLGKYDPSAGVLIFTAVDSNNQSTAWAADVEVDSSPTLTEIEAVAGQILDADCARLLVLDPDGQTVKIYERSTRQYTSITTIPPNSLASSFLTPRGAILSAYDPADYAFIANFSKLLEWSSGTLTLLDNPNSSSSLAIAGDHAIWSNGPGLTLRDLTTGTNVAVSNSAGNWKNSVAANGDVVFGGFNDSQIYRWRSGTTTQLTNDSSMNTYPLTDGTNVVYRKNAPNSSSFGLALFGSSGEVLLDPVNSLRSSASIPITAPEPGADYRVDAGWVAYTAPKGGAFQIFTRDPSGTTYELTQFGSNSVIDAMDSAGGVMLLQPVNAQRMGRRYFASTGVTPVVVSGQFGTPISMGGSWYLMLGRSLFAVANAGDAGSLDGGSCGFSNYADAPTNVDAAAEGASPTDGGASDEAPSFDARAEDSSTLGLVAQTAAGNEAGSRAGDQGGASGGGCEVSRTGEPTDEGRGVVWWACASILLVACRRRSLQHRHRPS